MEFVYNNLTHNLYYSTDPESTIDFLVDQELNFTHFSRDFVQCKMVDLDLHLVLFLKDQKDKPFVHFYFDDFLKDTDTIELLINEFKRMASSNYQVYKTAQKKLEGEYYMVPTYRALYKYKFDEDTLSYHP